LHSGAGYAVVAFDGRIHGRMGNTDQSSANCLTLWEQAAGSAAPVANNAPSWEMLPWMSRSNSQAWAAGFCLRSDQAIALMLSSLDSVRYTPSSLHLKTVTAFQICRITSSASILHRRHKAECLMPTVLDRPAQDMLPRPCWSGRPLNRQVRGQLAAPPV